jgi:hypothetical protein
MSFVLTVWSSCRGPRWSAASELAVALSITPWLSDPERQAGPSVPRFATPHVLSGATPRSLLRAERRRGARPLGRCRSPNSTGAALVLENGAEFLVGPTAFIESAEEPESSANFGREASSATSVLFLGLSSPKANETVSFVVSFHQGPTQSGILFLVSIARANNLLNRQSHENRYNRYSSRFLAPP